MAALNVVGPGAEELREKLRNGGCQGACSRDTPLVPPAELADYMKALPAWRVSSDGKMITRKFMAKNFMAAMDFFNKAAEVAEAEGHHPDLHLRNYREVEVEMWTHAADGLTLADLVMAAKLDMIDVQYSPKWVEQQIAEQQAAAAE